MQRSPAEIEALIAELARHGLGGLAPGPEQLRALIEADRGGPLHFVNLLAFHEQARYPADHPMAARRLRGAEAYALYGVVAVQQVTRRGGRVVAVDEVEQVVIGADARWHQVAILEYPHTDAFLDMIRDPAYRAALVHRDAGLAETLVLVTRPRLAASTR